MKGHSDIEVNDYFSNLFSKIKQDEPVGESIKTENDVELEKERNRGHSGYGYGGGGRGDSSGCTG